MATPLTADKFMSVLKNAQLGVVEHGSRRTHNRNQYGNWGPVNGVVIAEPHQAESHHGAWNVRDFAPHRTALRPPLHHDRPCRRIATTGE